MQPMIQLRANNDPTNMNDKGYLPLTKVIDVVISGSDPVTPWLIPAGTYIEKVVGLIKVALDAGTVDVGDEDTAAKFIANNEWTETTVNQLATSLETTAPDGVYYPAAKLLKLTFGATTTSGTVRLMITYWELGSMIPNQAV